jgi:hypothetical protein
MERLAQAPGVAAVSPTGEFQFDLPPRPVKGPARPARTMDNAHALVAGVAACECTCRPSPTNAKDAQDVYDVLIDPRHGSYRAVNVRSLLDSQATQSALRQALADLGANSDRASTVLLFVAAHGVHIESGSQAGDYLLPADAICSSGELIARTAISGAELTAALRAIPAGRVVAIIDCCHAGHLDRLGDDSVPVIRSGFSPGFYDELMEGQGRVILVSSRHSECSRVKPGAQNGLFAQHLLAGLRGGVPSEDGLIRVFDLFEYLQPRVTGDEPRQHPILLSNMEEDFAVALYKGGEKGTIPKDEQGFRYDAYVSYAEAEPDATWVWETLIPRLLAAGLRVAVSGDAERPNVGRVVNIKRGMQQARRVVAVVSEAFLAGCRTTLSRSLPRAMDMRESRERILPVAFAPVDGSQLPPNLDFSTVANLVEGRQAKGEYDRLLEALRSPLPAQG